MIVNEAVALWLAQPYALDVPLTLEEFLARPAWHARALCRGSGAAAWISASEKAHYAVQRAVCVRCPVREPCLDFALADPSIVGCWGGTDERERRALRRGRAA